MKNPLLDTEFLRKLDANHNRTIYAKIISLNQYEYPIEQIEGVVTAGSISIDGESAVRRICQLTLSAKNLNINNVYWGLTTKIKIEIGLENTIINNDYDDIIWFKQGIFILTDFKTNQSTNNYTINITGKDKMCLLNGDVAGNFLNAANFDCYTIESNDRAVVDENGDFNLFKQKVKNSNIEDESGEQYNDFNYSHQLNKITALFYYPSSSSRQGKIKFNLGNTMIDLNSIITETLDSSAAQPKYLVDFGARQIDGFIVSDCTPGDYFEWNFDTKIPIPTIIESMLHQYGQEKLSNIIIKDLDPFALEMVDSYNDEPMYVLYGAGQNYAFVNKQTLLNDYVLLTDAPIDENFTDFVFATNTDEDNFNLLNNVNSYTAIKSKTDNSKSYFVIQVSYGEVAGYRMTPLVYPDTLTANVGESITSILDKIVKCLGQFEYFYNLDGQFVFQAKPAYVEVPWNNTIQLIDDNYVDPGEVSKRIGYIFDSADMTTQYTNSPNMNNVKNDYSIWGERTSNGQKTPIHARYAIDNPPIEYTDFDGYTWCALERQQNIGKIVTNETGNIRKNALEHIVDWRHLIYIMWEDWFKHNREDDFEVLLRTNNNWPDLNLNLFPLGKTGYEQYYNDLQGYWPLLYDIAALQQERNPQEDFVVDNTYYQDGKYKYWAKNIIEDPAQLDFWFDFFKADEMGIGKFAVSVIGDRPKTINNSIIKVITYRDAPDIVYCTVSEYEYYTSLKAIKPGYVYILLPDEDNDFYNSLTRTVRGRSAHQEAENMLYQYSFYNDNVNITSIPIYYLNPNTLISIKDELSNIIGYYAMTKINLSLAYNGTMSISATKIPERIY